MLVVPALIANPQKANATDIRSVILLVIAGEAASVLTRLSLPEERLPDRLQLGQLQTDLLQVEGTAILDLSHGERVHVHKSDIHQLPAEEKQAAGVLLCKTILTTPTDPDLLR